MQFEEQESVDKALALDGTVVVSLHWSEGTNSLFRLITVLRVVFLTRFAGDRVSCRCSCVMWSFSMRQPPPRLTPPPLFHPPGALLYDWDR